MNTGITVKLLGRACGCIRPSSCLVVGCTLVAGTLSGFGLKWAAAWREVLDFLSQFKCAATEAYCICRALNYFLALVKLGFVPTASVSVTVGGFVGAKGSVGTTMSRRLIFREEIAVLPGSHRPVQQQAWFLDRAPLPC